MKGIDCRNPMAALALAARASALAAGLSGCCANVSTDPRAGGLAGGACGLATGAYDQRLAERRDDLAALDAINARLRGELRDTRRDTALVDRVLAGQRQRAAMRAAALDELERRLAELRGAKARSEAERDVVKADVAAAAHRMASVLNESRQLELATRALREGQLAAIDRRQIEQAVAQNREDDERLASRLSALQKAMATDGMN